MKSIAIIILFLFFNHGFAQSKTQNVEVVYNVYRAYAIPYKFQAVLYTKGDVSIWKDQWNTRELWKERPVADDLKHMQIIENAFKDDAEPCLRTDLSKKQILFHGAILRNWFLVEDNFIDFQWNITKENKMLAGFNCIKATTTFRGREWTVWFTPEIPVPFGPWKLRGLPGLIMEAVDSSNTFIYQAVNIKPLEDDAIFKKDFASLMPLKNQKIISYEQLLNDTEEAEENALNATAQKLNVTVKATKPSRSTLEEVKYEWED